MLSQKVTATQPGLMYGCPAGNSGCSMDYPGLQRGKPYGVLWSAGSFASFCLRPRLPPPVCPASFMMTVKHSSI